MALITDLFKGAMRHKLITGLGVAAAIHTTQVHPMRGMERGLSSVAVGDPNALPSYMHAVEYLNSYAGTGLEMSSYQENISATSHNNLRASYYSGPVPNVDANITDIPTDDSLKISSGISQNPNMGALVLGLHNNRLKG